MKFLTSSYRWTYFYLGLKHWVSPNRVQELAHGASPAKQNEYYILAELVERGIIG